MVPETRVSLFTLFSCALVVAFVLAIYLPGVRGERIFLNEQEAFRSLQTVFRLEREYQRRAKRQPARFLFLPELAAMSDATGIGERFRRALGSDFDGPDLRSAGYRLRVYLPDAEGHGITLERCDEVSERQSTGVFACYAWPERFGSTGRRAFLLLADGAILSSENTRRRYEGRDRAPRPGAGFAAADPDRIVDSPAVAEDRDKGRGTDGQIWRR